MKLKSETSAKKLRGAYYTPKKLADCIIEKLTDSNKVQNILEPSCGDGVFIESILESGVFQNASITGVEIDEHETRKLKKKYLKNSNLEIVHSDFFNFHSDKITTKYDLIVGNPPYIRYQYLTTEQRSELSIILETEGMKSNKLINAWVGFTVACSTMLSDKGTLVFVLPAELLQVVYAKDLREMLLKRFNDITIITFTKLVFDDIEQETVLLKCTKSSENKGIRIVETRDVDSFSSIDLSDFEYISAPCSKEKWTKYFTSRNDIMLINSMKNDVRFQKFSDVAKINVGITTGNNKFFSLEKSLVEKYDLHNVSCPLIGRSSHVKGLHFRKKDYLDNYNDNRKSRLLALTENRSNYNDLQNEYITLGEKNGEHTGYKCSIRKYWFAIPSMWVPDAFFLRRNNIYPKMVLNDINAVSTDTMHRIAFKEGFSKENILLSYYNSISFAFTEINGRSYGGGVLEILPSEVGEVLLPKIENVSLEVQNDLLMKIDKIIRKRKDIELVLDLVDKTILIDHVGLSEFECKEFRGIWKKMQNRRLGRSR
jgi:adenine-specific DNA-methyltransferase